MTDIGKQEINFGFAKVSSLVQTEYTQDVIKRLIPQRFSDFELQVDPKITDSVEDVFIVSV